jgi:hypothetical protein
MSFTRGQVSGDLIVFEVCLLLENLNLADTSVSPENLAKLRQTLKETDIKVNAKLD